MQELATAEQFIEQVVNKIRNLGLAVPAVFLLEAHKPLAFLGSQLLLVAQPALTIFLPHHLIHHTCELLADPHRLEQLIVRIETATAGSPPPENEAL